MFNVCLMGASFTTGNMGVSALAASLVKLILMNRPDANITFFIPERKAGMQEIELLGKLIEIRISNFRLSPKSKIGEHLFVIFFLALLYRIIPLQGIRDMIIGCNDRIKLIANADFIGDIRGGDSFSDIYGLYRITVGSMPSFIALFMGKKLVLLPQTYGPYESRIAKKIAGFIFKHSHIIISRDHEGIATVRDILGSRSNEKSLLFCPDVAFVLDSYPPGNQNFFTVSNTGTNRPVIGFNINGLMYNGGYTRENMFKLKLDYRLFVHQLSKRLLEETDANLLFIPHTFAPRGHVESDPDACADVFNSLSSFQKGRLRIAEGEIDQHAIKGIISLCDFFIGSRMHACIAALSQSIPTAGVAYSKKFMGVFDSVGMGHMVIDARTTDVNEAADAILDYFRKRDKLKSDLDSKIEAAKGMLQNIFRRLVTEQADSCQDRPRV